jgi:hydroxybutyrate-dimer hydrolase
MTKSLLSTLLATTFCLAPFASHAAGTFNTSSSGSLKALTLSVAVTPDSAVAGQNGNFYVAANLGGSWYFKTASGWQAWSSGALPVYASGPLTARTVPVLAADLDLGGVVGAQLYVGYGLSDNDMVSGNRFAKVYTAGPANLLKISSLSYDGNGDDLLTAGLGQSGIGSSTSPATQAGFNAASAASLRRLAIYNNYRALIDPAVGGGFGTLYGPNVANDGVSKFNNNDGKIAGDEVLGLYDPGDGSQMVTLMVQIPASFDKSNPCLITATSSGSRGIYGAVGTAGDWGLKQGCAVVYNDKGSGNGAHALSSGVVTRAEGLFYGTRAAAFDGSGNPLLPFPQFLAKDDNGNAISPTHAYNSQYPNRYAFKHAHSQVNPEKSWGSYVLDSIRFALNVLNEKYGGVTGNGLPNAIFAAKGSEGAGQTGVLVIASSVSNGGGSALKAAEQDSSGLITAVAVSEPQVQPDLSGRNLSIAYGSNVLGNSQIGRPLYDYVTLYALYQPCASLANPTAAGYASLNGAGQQANRCKALARNGLLGGIADVDTASAAAVSAAAGAAQATVDGYGIISEQNPIAPGYESLRTHSAVAMAYANAYGKFAVTQNLCGYSYAGTTGSGAVTALAAASDALLFASGNGVPSTGGVNLVNNLSPGGAMLDNTSSSASSGLADINFDGVFCLRKYATGSSGGAALSGSELSAYQRIQAGIAEVRANGNLHGKPAIIVHGRSDALLPPNHTSRAYFGLNKAVEGAASKLSYIEVTNGQHLDTLNSAFYPTLTIPLHVYLVKALNAVYAQVKSNAALPPSQVVRASPRASSSETLGSDKLPAISANPAASDAITFSANTVNIPL